MTTQTILCSDAIEFFRSQPAESVDLVFGSPPYMDARTYGIDAMRGCQEWVEWMLDVIEAAVRVSRGLVLWVVAGVQRDNCYWPGCEGLAWEWWKRGNHLWRPCVWWKVDHDEGGNGIPGSGGSVPGKRWLRADWEYVLCFKRPGGIPYDDPKVMGHAPIVPHLGGEMSNRTVDRRTRRANGTRRRRRDTMDVTAGHDAEGVTGRSDGRPMPKIANPGNCIVVKARVGGGHMGDRTCSENEAPFPEALAEFFVRSYSPPDGLVCDPFSGSGTTAAVCKMHGRNFLGCDIRQSQVELGMRRLANITPPLFTEAQ